MPDVSSFLPYWLWPGDGRDPADVEDDIAAELEFHLDMLAEENERQGMAPDQARQAAEATFGDREAFAKQCRQIKRGDIVMLQRFVAIVSVVLVLSVVGLAWQTYQMNRDQALTRELLTQNQDEMRRLATILEQNQPAPATPSTSDSNTASATKSPTLRQPSFIPSAAAVQLAQQRVELLTRRLELRRQSLATRQDEFRALRQAEAKSARAMRAAVDEAQQKVAKLNVELAKLVEQRKQLQTLLASAEETTGNEASEVQIGEATQRLDSVEAKVVRLQAQLENAERQVTNSLSAESGRALEWRARREGLAEKFRQAEEAVLQAELDLQEAEAEQLALQSGKEKSPVQRGDVSGGIFATTGEPIPGAQVLAVIKTWHGGYSQRGYTTKSDSKGLFTLRNAISLNRKYAVQLATFADGFAFASYYKLQENATGQPVEKVELFLNKATPIQVRVIANLKPDAKQRFVIRPVQRQPRPIWGGRETHLVYSEGIELVEVLSDDAGCATIPWLAIGDRAQISVSLQGENRAELKRLTVEPNGLLKFAALKPGDDYHLVNRESL
ncbi:MAG: permease prefix domain 1-containing protein [Planctomycetota bacterium]